MKRSILGVCLALFAASSFASGIGNSYGGEGGKGGAATATGGNATGGNATGGAGYGGAGGSVLGSGNSSNANTNLQGQAQGQIATGGQGGMGGQGGAGGSAISGSTSGAFSGGNSQNSRNDSSASATANPHVEIKGDEAARIPVSTAYAPMISPTAVCALGLSGGAQGVGFGVSFGSSYIDENCQKLEQIRTVSTVLGDRATAAEMMCSVPAYKEARERTGKPCGGAAKVSAAPVGQPVSASKADYEAKKKAAGYQGDDPVVLGRLGIAPLK